MTTDRRDVVGCLVCTGRAEPAERLIIRGEPRTLHACTRCGLSFFVAPDWLAAAYTDPIAQIDTGLADRCVKLAWLFEAIARSEGLDAGPFLDVGGGYGLLTRLVRDHGLDMYHSDPMTTNLFAQQFERTLEEDFAMISMIEVLEHLVDPAELFAEAASHAEYVLATTVLRPPPPASVQDWWYLAPDTGQHITFYTPDSLRELGRRFGLSYTGNGRSVHLFHRRRLHRTTRAVMREPRLCLPVALALRGLHHGRSLAASDGALAADLVRRTHEITPNGVAD